MSKVFQPDHILTDNPHGAIVYGPITPEDTDDGTRYLQTSTGGHITWANKNGNTTTITPGQNSEICGRGLVQGKNTDATDESVAKAIIARKGDIVITAEQGNIKLKAKNIWIETSGEGSAGNFHVNSNGHVNLTAGEKVTIGGTKMCLIGKENIALSSDGFINAISEGFNHSAPFSPLFGIFQNMSMQTFIALASSECGGGLKLL